MNDDIRNHIASGNHWKAKEIMQGWLSGSNYDTELYEHYGKLLLSMHDKMEAGKYLFLSGVEKPEYEEAIGLYLGRYKNKATSVLINTFPRSAKNTNHQKYPKSVLEVLEGAGHKRSDIDSATRLNNRYEPEEFSKTSIYGGLAIIFLILLGLVVQGFRGLIWLWQWLF